MDGLPNNSPSLQEWLRFMYPPDTGEDLRAKALREINLRRHQRAFERTTRPARTG